MPTPERPIAVFYEHPAWFEPMFAEFERRGVPAVRLEAHRHRFDPSETESPWALVLNRMSPSAFTRGHAHAIPYTLEWLAHLDRIGAPVLNGLEAYRHEFSKVRQLALMARLGIRHPRARAFNHPSQAVAAADGLAYPVLVKPNVGGSGAGIRRFDAPAELRAAAEAEGFDLGLDGVALVQEYHRPEGGAIVRIEALAGELLYAIRLRLDSPDSFNLCPADYCRVEPGRVAPVEATEPPREAVDDALRVLAAAGIETGGVEYLVSERDGERYLYDVNALSNFVANAPAVVGFDPFPRLVDYALERAGALQPA